MTLSVLGQQLASSVAGILPSAVGAVILLAIGWGLGKALGKITEEILKKSKIDKYVFKKKKPIISIAKITAIVVSWSIYLLFIQASIEVLGIQSLADEIGAIVDFLPKLIVATYIIIAGYAIAEMAKRRINMILPNYGTFVKELTYWIVIYIAFTIALSTIGIDVFLLDAILIIFLASLAISFGIASSSIMKDELEKIMKHKNKRNKKSK